MTLQFVAGYKKGYFFVILHLKIDGIEEIEEIEEINSLIH